VTPCVTPRNVQVLVAWARCGGVKGAAWELHISGSAVRQHLARCREATGVSTNQQAVYQLLIAHIAA
jgi:DNA-binding transcriptional LysR family regulator